LQQALTLDPQLTMAEASLGILRARQGRLAEAKTALQEAVKGDSNNYLAHYYYAYALSREGMDANNMVQHYEPETTATMRAELRKAIDLSPTFPESYSLLAFINVVSGEQLDESVILLKHALALSPGRQDLDLELAQIYLRQEKFELARETLDPLRNAKDRRLHLQAESLLNSIKNYEEQMARYKSGANATGETRLQRRDENSATSAKEDAPPQQMSPSDELRQVLRPLAAGEEQIQGLFLRLECDNSKGIGYFIVQAADRIYKIRATSLGQVQFTAYTPVADEVSCGPRKTQDNVVLTFRPSKDAKDVKSKIDGDAIAVELVPKDFQLKK